MMEEERQNYGYTFREGATLDPSLVKWQLDDSDVLNNLRMILEGMSIIYDEETDSYQIVRTGEPLMNEYGIRLLLDTVFRAVTTKNIKLSNMNQKDVYMLARFVLNEVARLLFTHGDEFGVKDLATRSAIMETLRTNIIAAFKRPFGEGERKFIKGFVEEKHSIGQEEKKRGLF